MRQLSNRLFLVLPMTLALILLLASPAYAHGGLPEQLHDFYRPIASWMVVLIYIQLALIPVVGIWLVGEAVAAWRPQRDR